MTHKVSVKMGDFHTLVDATLAGVDKNVLIQRLIADKAYDSQSLRDELADQQIELIAPHQTNRKQPKTP